MKKYFLFLGILFLFIICYQNWNKTKNLEVVKENL